MRIADDGRVTVIFETFVYSSFLILLSREHVVGGRGLYGGLSVRGQRKALLGGQPFRMWLWHGQGRMWCEQAGHCLRGRSRLARNRCQSAWR